MARRATSSAPLEVHLAVTARCGAGCKGCYLDARPDGVEPPRETLERELDALRDAGVFTVAFGGGEPTTRDDLDVLAAQAARPRAHARADDERPRAVRGAAAAPARASRRST